MLRGSTRLLRGLNLFLTAVFLVGFGCHSSYSGDIRDPAQEFNICEAVFRYQFKFQPSPEKRGGKPFYLTIGGKDPTEEFMLRFRDSSRPILRGSEFKVGTGTLFHIQTITWLDTDTAEVYGGHYVGDLSASWHVYHVSRRNGTWVVDKDEIKVIS